jgi:hypothetical protein
MTDPTPRPHPVQLLLAADELDQRADDGAFRDRMGEMRHTWESFRQVAAWLRAEATPLVAGG